MYSNTFLCGFYVFCAVEIEHLYVMEHLYEWLCQAVFVLEQQSYTCVSAQPPTLPLLFDIRKSSPFFNLVLQRELTQTVFFIS